MNTRQAASETKPRVNPQDLVVAPARLPDNGMDREDVLQALRDKKSGDADWQGGRVPLFVFRGSEAAYEMGRDAFFEYFTENALGAGRAFPSVRSMEQEILGMALNLFNAPSQASGFLSTGGTESIILAVQTCRNEARARRGDPAHRGNIVLPASGHPAFDKAAQMMDLTVRRVPLQEDYRGDVSAMADQIDDDTIMLVGSAPCFPFGLFDPIAALSELALERNVWLHVDACVGGYLAPFARNIGYPVPEFDFGLRGVSSMSADLHKYGWGPKPSSTVLYRDASLAAWQPFYFDNWPNGIFVTPTVVGTRPAGGVAGAWATMQMLGRSGYEAIAGELMGAVSRYRETINSIAGLSVVGDPELSIVAYTSDEQDIFAVAQALRDRGWQPGLLQQPRAIHRMMSMLHVDSMDEYLADLKAVVADPALPSQVNAADAARYT
jgi:glutamate/tyrosine decarboxylase-like PLP-dependent enzyme